MGKSDAVIGMLKRQGFVALRVPRADLKPLQVFAKSGSDLEFRGEIADLLISTGMVLPNIGGDETMANFNGQRSSEQKFGVGLTILGGIIGAMGGSKLGLDAKFGNAKNAQFEFQNVVGNKINVFKLEEYVNAADINPALPSSARMLEDDKLYVITAVVKSNKFGFVVKDSSNKEIGIEVPVIKEIVGGNVKIDRSSSNQNVTTFEGPEKLVFGLQALRMIFDNGEFSMFKSVEPGSVAARSASEIIETDSDQNGSERSDVEPLTSNAPFVPVGPLVPN